MLVLTVTHTPSLFSFSTLFKWFQMGFCAMCNSWEIEKVLTWSSDSTIFFFFFDVFDNWPSRALCIFNITELTKPKLPPGFRFRLYQRKNVRYGVFPLCLLEACLNKIESRNYKTIWNVFVFVRNLILTPYSKIQITKVYKIQISNIKNFFLIYLVS